VKLTGTTFTFLYADGTEYPVPTTMTMAEAREVLAQALDDDESWVRFLRLTVAGEAKETWMSLEEIRAIDTEPVVLVQLKSKKGKKRKRTTTATTKGEMSEQPATN
jgi:hypothetical protein